MQHLLLIPGMMCDARMWANTSTLPARVHHALPTGAETIATLAADILHNAPPTFALAGLSMGGIVAMQIVALAPNRVTRLALLDTNPLAELPEAQARRIPQIARAQTHLADVMRDIIPNYLAETPHKADIAALCLDMALTLGPETFTRQSRALASRPDQTATLRGYPGPTLILMGAQDRLCPRARHDLMHALLPQSDLVIIEQAGHLPTLENPTQTTAALTRWLEP